MDVCYISIFYIHHFSLNRNDVAAKQRCVAHNQRQDGARKMLVLFGGDMLKGNNNISNCQEICIVLCKMPSMSSVNYGRGCTAGSVVSMFSK